MVVFSAVFPTFAVIVIGYFLRKLFITSAEFWTQTDRLIYFFLMPMFLVQILSQAKFSLDMLQKGGVIFATVTIMAIICFATRPFMRATDKEFTSVFQGVVRTNFYMSISLAALLYNTEGIEFLSFLLIFLIPSATVYSVIVLQHYGHTSSSRTASIIVKRILKNPIIIATFLGLMAGALFGGFSKIILETMEIFGDATLPLALLGIGASLEFKALKMSIFPLMAGTLLRLVVAPVLCFLLCYALGFSEMETVCCMLIFAVPSAASAITFASQMGGDTRLMSSILTTQTILSFVTLTFMIAWVHYVF